MDGKFYGYYINTYKIRIYQIQFNKETKPLNKQKLIKIMMDLAQPVTLYMIIYSIFIIFISIFCFFINIYSYFYMNVIHLFPQLSRI